MADPVVPPSPAPSLVVLGNFDGVHRGHQAVLRAACERADTLGLLPVVLTFHPHPAAVLGKQFVQVLTALPRKVALIERLSPRIEVCVVPFTLDLAHRTAEEFVELILVRQLNARFVLVGENFRFGRGREGDFARLVELGRAHGFEAHAEALLGDETGPLSSSRVRELLLQGDVEGAERILGRRHSVTGRVGHGDHRGRTIGFPTANLHDLTEALPSDGVYVARVLGGTVPMGYAVVNIGERPTVDRPRTIEAYVLDFHGDLYGAQLTLEFVARLRDTTKFGSLDELKAGIARDVAEARRIVHEPPASSEPSP
ncbi:MAG TPA: bifunctional riboflavin kinase/FAD synthetase [Polyangiaceae bacterium]|nr:bifunctional riboflavin kinase/FAD synthetase [Polyangiaceae bacterium]